CCPRIQHIWVAREAAGDVTLFGAESLGHILYRIDRKLAIGGHDRLIVIWPTLGIGAVPQWDGHPEDALTRDQPVTSEVLDPVGVTRLHEAWMPDQFVTVVDEVLAQVCIAATVAKIPLARGDNFQRLIAFFEKVHGMRDLFRLAIEQISVLEH